MNIKKSIMLVAFGLMGSNVYAQQIQQTMIDPSMLRTSGDLISTKPYLMTDPLVLDSDLETTAMPMLISTNVDVKQSFVDSSVLPEKLNFVQTRRSQISQTATTQSANFPNDVSGLTQGARQLGRLRLEQNIIKSSMNPKAMGRRTIATSQLRGGK